VTQRDVIADLTAEAEEVDRLVADLDPTRWARVTPAPGWTVAHQIAHLAFIFRIAGLAAADGERFRAMVASVGGNFDQAVNAGLREYLEDPPEVLLNRWRTERDTAIKALAAAPPDQLVPWLVRPLPPAVLACAGIMELVGHGQDVADALGVTREYTDRLWHLAWFATLTWEFGYQSRGMTPPDVQFRYELTAPSGALWTFGPDDAAQRITGPAVDFCLLVTRRRHRDDLALTATGPDADAWLDIAQAYRGPAGEGRRPGQFS
jgi:enediyne biosynthesis protein E11